MFHTALYAWVKYYRGNKDEIKRSLVIKRKQYKQLKKHALKNWINRSMARISRIRSINILKHIRNKKLVGKRFD
jgi:hypothetical protein